MVEPVRGHLKVYDEQAPAPNPPAVESVASLPELLAAFEKLAGWRLRYVPTAAPEPGSDRLWSAPVNPGMGVAPGHLKLEALGPDRVGLRAAAQRNAAQAFSVALAGMLGEMLLTRRALWQREAELAAGVPLVPCADESRHLAARLESVLRGGAEAIGCQAAALYLLDEGTSQLKLRSCWGLPLERLTEPARPLRGAVADLEALLGHAVVLEDESLMRHWRVPEDFPAAVCVPVATETTILGTFWVFANAARRFSDAQTNILEVVAGRLASDLEREMLLAEGLETAHLKRHWQAAQQHLADQVPAVTAMIDGWDFAAWTSQSQRVGGSFFDWFPCSDSRLAVAVGRASGSPMEAAMSAATLRALLRAEGHHCRESSDLLAQVNRSFCAASPGDQQASAVCGIIDSRSNQLDISTGGSMRMLLLQDGAWRTLTHAAPAIGQHEAVFAASRLSLERGAAVLCFTDSVAEAADSQGRMLGESSLIAAIADSLHLPAASLSAKIGQTIAAHTRGASDIDGSLLVLRRANP